MDIQQIMTEKRQIDKQTDGQANKRDRLKTDRGEIER